jgi:hypothetical protein
MAFVGMMFVGCDEGSLEIPYYQFSKISKCERDSIKTLMQYGDRGLSRFEVLVHDNQVSVSYVSYTTSAIHCTIRDISYNIHLDNTRGGTRAEFVQANKGNSELYSIEYTYDDLSRLSLAKIQGVGEAVVYVSYQYEDKAVVINDAGTRFRIELSSGKNVGYVCNVLDFADAYYTSKYVIHPDLYYLNIYGAPVEWLPSGHEVTFCENNTDIAQVGKYFYEY